MKSTLFFILSFLFSEFGLAQILMPVQELSVCDQDRDGFVSIPFSQLQNYALDVLSDFNESPEIYLTKAHRGVEKVIKLYDNPQRVLVCGDTDGQGGYYDIAINSQKEIFVTRKYGVLQKLNTETCEYQTIGQIHPNGQTVLALSFDHLNHLYEGGWTSQVYRSDSSDITNFYLWHDFGIGNASGDFVQIGDFLYIAWTMPDGKDHLLKVTLGTDNAYVSHIDLGQIETGTFGLAAEYGRLYGNTVDFLYEINLQNMQRTIIAYRDQSSNANQWWGAAGYHEALNIEISYHNSQADAEIGINPINDPFTNPIAFQDAFVFIRVHESTQNITYIIPVHILIQIPPEANDSSLTECRDPETSLATFELDDAQNDINPDPNLNFSFFNSIQDLENNANPLPVQISIAEDKTVFVKVDSESQDCYGIAQLMLKIPVPDIDYQSTLAFCKGTSAVLSIPNEFTSYEWSGLSGEDLNQPLNTHEVTVTQTGDYSVSVTNLLGCVFTFPFHVEHGGSPVITGVIFNGDQSVTVQVSPAGNYEYSLDGVFWQNSPVFSGLQPYDYQISVRDLFGCYSEKYNFTFFIIPNFISPNGDGSNDFWNIRGMAQYPNAEIKIFDRYGKLFVDRKINSNDLIWDGKYMGESVQSGDYWFILSLDEEHKISGHITVRN